MVDKYICFDTDDLSFENNNFWYLEKLKDQYKDFKISAFYIPIDAEHYKLMSDEQRATAKEMIVHAVKDGWLELIPHGVSHQFGEFKNADIKTMELVIQAYDDYFKQLGVPYVKGFKAPNWLLSNEAIQYLNDIGWWVAVDRNNPYKNYPKRPFMYNWSIDEEMPNLPILKAHSHISLPSKNNLPDCIDNMFRIPPEYKWKFVSEVIDIEGI